MGCTDLNTEDDQHWSLESLNKAYQQGYMAGLTGQTNAPPRTHRRCADRRLGSGLG